MHFVFATKGLKHTEKDVKYKCIWLCDIDFVSVHSEMCHSVNWPTGLFTIFAHSTNSLSTKTLHAWSEINKYASFACCRHKMCVKDFREKFGPSHTLNDHPFKIIRNNQILCLQFQVVPLFFNRRHLHASCFCNKRPTICI